MRCPCLCQLPNRNSRTGEHYSLPDGSFVIDHDDDDGDDDDDDNDYDDDDHEDQDEQINITVWLVSFSEAP